MRTDTGVTVRLEDYEPTPYRAPSTRLLFALHPTATVVQNETDYEPRGSGADGPLELVGDGLRLLGAKLDGVALREGEFTATPDSFTLLKPPRRKFTLTLTTAVSPDTNTELMGLYRSNGVYCTQCEAEGFRRITYAYDRPDVLTVYDVWMMADAPGTPALLSNGNLVGEGEMDGRRWARWVDPFPKPTYLFALVAGDLGLVKDTFTTRSGRTVRLGIYVERGKEPRAAYAMDALKRSMQWDEERFGLEYDLDDFNIVAVSDFNMGAMENKGLNVFNDAYVLADPTVATDGDYSRIETVIAHEYFHNWTGNRITCRDWFQLCLKEGLTVFRDQEFTSDVRSRGVKRVEDVKRLRTLQFREDASPLRHPVRPNQYAEISNLYTATVYDKGAEVIRMIHTIIGEQKFRAGMDRYFQRYDGTAATVEEFVGCFDLDVPDFMRWYEEAGTPTVAVDEAFEDGRYTLTLRQKPAEGAALKPIPVRLALHGAERTLDLASADVAGGTLAGDLLMLGGDEASISVDGLNEPPVASVFRGFSAPVHIERPDDPARDLAALARDDDPFSIWDAAQRLMLGAVIGEVRGSPRDIAPLAEALTAPATDERLEPHFRAMLLTVPTRTAIVEALGSDVDADKVEAAHRALSAALGRAMAPALRTLAAAAGPAEDDVSAEAAGRRALRNAAVTLLAYAGEDGLAADTAAAARNMTDRIAAVGALAATGSPLADAALAAFEAAFRDEPLVLDKYFGLQAMRTDDDPLARTRALLDHPNFTMKNPNRVRAVVGSFAANLPAFHAADGSGYRFVGEIALALDAANPQLAARLLTAFNDVRRFDAPRRAAARAVLEDVAGKAKSSDVADIVRRLLAA
jgi:aminopeptidase N